MAAIEDQLLVVGRVADTKVDVGSFDMNRDGRRDIICIIGFNLIGIGIRLQEDIAILRWFIVRKTGLQVKGVGLTCCQHGLAFLSA